MKREKIVSLELIRILAATWVLYFHFASYTHTFENRYLFALGQFPVMVFFVVSGFVMGNKYGGQKINLKEYFSARFIRIYPIYVLVLLLSTVFFLMHDRLAGLAPQEKSLGSFVGNLLMLQAPTYVNGRQSAMPWMGNIALWSLAPEWWYYVLFGLLSFKLGNLRMRVLAFTLSAAGLLYCVTVSNVVSTVGASFVIWWAGAELATQLRTTGKLSLARSMPVIACLGGLAAMKPVFERLQKIGHFNWPPDFHMQENFYLYGAVIVVAACLFPGFLSWSPRIGKKFISYLGGISYPLYLVHLPIILVVQHFTPRISLQLLSIPLSFMVAHILEMYYQPLFNRFRVRPSKSVLILDPSANKDVNNRSENEDATQLVGTG